MNRADLHDQVDTHIGNFDRGILGLDEMQIRITQSINAFVDELKADLDDMAEMLEKYQNGTSTKGETDTHRDDSKGSV